MEYEGARTIPAPREAVWEPITDPATLAACLEGAEAIERRSETVYEGVVRQEVAGIAVTLEGRLQFEELHPPERLSFALTGTDARTNSRLEAEADVRLADAGASTELDYVVDASFAGRLATLGSRVLRRQVEANLDAFFDNLVAHVGGDGRPPRPDPGSNPATGDPDGR